MSELSCILDAYGCKPKQNFWEIRVYINTFIYKQSKMTNFKKNQCVELVRKNRDDIAI